MMTKDEIIRMAEEAGFKRETTLTYGYPYTAYKANIERFAALVAAHEREKQEEQKPVAWVSEDVCNGQFINGKKRRLWWECIEGAGTPFYAAPVSIEAAVLAEREACAKVCETEIEEGEAPWTACDYAAAIRARSNNG